jgi:hypothetical protein
MITRRPIRLTLLAMLATASMSACSSSNGGAPSSNDAGGDVTSLPAETTQTVGAAGGTVAAQGASLTFPAGAVASDAQITVTANAGATPSGYTALSVLYSFTSSGAALLEPVTISLTLQTPARSAVIFLSNQAGGFDPLPTTASGDTLSAQTSRLGDCFAGLAPDAGSGGSADAGTSGSSDGGATATDSGASEATDSGAGAANDSGSTAAVDATVEDATTPADAAGPASDATTAEDTGAPADAGSASDAGIVDAAAPFEAATDDAGVIGIVVTIDGVPTTFAANTGIVVSPADASTRTATLQGDDNPSSTHWTLQMALESFQGQSCAAATQTGYPAITYTHYTSGAVDETFSTETAYSGPNGGLTCSIQLPLGLPATSGQTAKGTFSGTVYGIPDAGTSPDGGVFTHTLAGGTFNEIVP